jgi:hypothetical protein
MMRKIIFPEIIFLFLLMFTNIASSQNSDLASFASIGFDGGYFLPLGEWKTHRYAEGIDQFQGNFKIGSEFEIKRNKIGIGFIGSYSRFDLSEWEQYAQLKGDIVDASASTYELGILLKYYLLEQKTNLASIDLGANYLFLNGRETFNSYSYNYDFLWSKFGFTVGISFKHLLADNLALNFNLRGVLLLEGIKYADGLTYDMIGLPSTIGIRYIF